MKDEELENIYARLLRHQYDSSAVPDAGKLLRSIEIWALREAADKLDQNQTDTPVSDLRCMARELEKLCYLTNPTADLPRHLK